MKIVFSSLVSINTRLMKVIGLLQRMEMIYIFIDALVSARCKKKLQRREKKRSRSHRFRHIHATRSVDYSIKKVTFIKKKLETERHSAAIR